MRYEVPGGSLSGVMDGGDGGFDSLVLNGGTFESVTYVAFDAHSGTIDPGAFWLP